MRNLPIPLLATAVLIALALVGRGGSPLLQPAPAQAIEIEPVVWQLNKDYPASIAPDGALPISNVYIKTHDGSDWMSTYDNHPSAISGPASIRALIDSYAQQGVEVSAWFVPKGHDYDRQVQMAVQVIDSGVKALYADLEPFQGFCYLDCRALAENFWYRVRQERPNAHLGVIYDPRPWWWSQSATAQWFSVADSALPMCYWESYSGQVPWGDPAGCVSQAHRDLKTLAPGRNLEYVPMLQGNSNALKFQQALDAAVVAGSDRVSVWRRGVVSSDIWDMLAGFQELEGPRCEDTPVDGCLVREATSQGVYLLQGGAWFSIYSPQLFETMGLDWRRVQVVPTGFVRQLRNNPVDGTLLREHGDTGVWVVYGGARFHIPSPDQLFALGFTGEQVRDVPPGALSRLSLIPEESVRLTELSVPAEYIVVRGGRLLVDDTMLAVLQATGGSGVRRYTIPDGALAQIPLTEIRRGDADCNGGIDAIDVMHLLRYDSALRPLGICTHLSGDADCSGTPGDTDALLLLRFLAGEVPAQPAGCSPIGMQVLPFVAPAPEPTPTIQPSLTPEPTAGSTDTPAPVATEVTPAATLAATPSATATPTATATASPTATPTPAAVSDTSAPEPSGVSPSP